jgi:hypothetical protein
LGKKPTFNIAGMKKIIHSITAVLLLTVTVNRAMAQATLNDKQATTQTVNLYHNLQKLLNKGFMFGHQDDLAYGVGWKYEPGRSDVKDVTGDYPAIYGFELGRLELDHPVNIDSVPFDKMRQFIHDAYLRGGVITLSWHFNNPFTGKTAWDAPMAGTVTAILDSPATRALYTSWLDKGAVFLQSLKGDKGEQIPIVLRLFHELNGSWFWWGRNNCTPGELKRLFQFTETYLRDTKHLHNLIYAYNTDRFTGADDYLERYPGNDYVDIIGFDIYQRRGGADSNAQFVQELDKSLATLEDIAAKNNKVPALTEFGYNGLPDSTWWTNVFAKGLGSHKISYVLGWRNSGIRDAKHFEYYVPYKGQASAADFVKFYQLPQTLFQKEVTADKLYK